MVFFRRLHLRLSVLMFLQFVVWGSWMITMGTYMLIGLGFSGQQVGAVYATTALAATVTPFWLGVLADRYFATQHLLAGLHLLGAILMYALSHTTAYGWYYAIMLAYTLTYMPTFSLANTLCFHHLREPARTFPRVRLWGTVSWIGVSLLLSSLEIEASVWPLRLSALASVVQAAYCLTLPHTPPQPSAIRHRLSWRAPEIQELARDRSLLVLIGALALICIPSAYYYSFVNPYLNEIGLSNAAGKMSIGQGVELLAILALPWLLSRWRLRWLLFTGLLLWGLRYAWLALGAQPQWWWLLYLGIGVHGFAYVFTALVAQIYIDSRVPVHLKGTAQGFVSFLTLGLGAFVGSYIAGMTVSAYTLPDGTHEWASIWVLPTLVGIATALGFVFLFRPFQAD